LHKRHLLLLLIEDHLRALHHVGGDGPHRLPLVLAARGGGVADGLGLEAAHVAHVEERLLLVVVPHILAAVAAELLRPHLEAAEAPVAAHVAHRIPLTHRVALVVRVAIAQAERVQRVVLQVRQRRVGTEHVTGRGEAGTPQWGPRERTPSQTE